MGLHISVGILYDAPQDIRGTTVLDLPVTDLVTLALPLGINYAPFWYITCDKCGDRPTWEYGVDALFPSALEALNHARDYDEYVETEDGIFCPDCIVYDVEDICVQCNQRIFLDGDDGWTHVFVCGPYHTPEPKNSTPNTLDISLEG